MIDLSKKTIQFCGKPRHFRRVPTRQLRDATTSIEDIVKPLAKIISDGEELKQRGMTIEREINQLRAEKPTKKNSKQIEDKESELKKVMKELQEITENLEGQSQEINDQVIMEYGRIALLFLEPLEEGEFEREYDTRDLVIAKNISMFYDMVMADFGENKVDARIRQLIEAEHDNTLSFQNQQQNI